MPHFAPPFTHARPSPHHIVRHQVHPRVRPKDPISNVRDDKQFRISGYRLKSWYKSLKALDDLRTRLEYLPLSRSEQQMLFRLTRQMEGTIRAMGGEVQEKLQG
ncbi:hypothetical protein CC86DRAFT_411297 [Ophiobolus disseminans]|uniref:Prion-inhibition and propagation HeLo domain-containing protein n=1 Tax=Ophiobolus disseminans TaxID=1469910 RepID=A0A6A6ZL73_9PLEO|nr:hypothetical protein CC86DRAFT_411297 [Ophiobolus disseminans]